MQIDTNTDANLTAKNTITAYFGSVERVTHNDGKMEWRRSVAGGLITYTTGSDFEMEGDAESRFIFKDHLGSIDVIADGFGNVEQSMSFDAWGARRAEDVNLTVYDAAALVTYGSDITSRGYTGHEMLDELGLIHMNGRVYDARLGRFLQADPFIQAASDTQMYNRYSYLRNNPLNATDPSGYFLKKLWNKVRPFVGAIVGIVIAVTCPACVASWYAAAATGAAAGAAGAAANGGTLRDVIRGGLIGGVSAAAFYGVGQGFSKGNCPACQAKDGAGVFGTKLTGTAFANKVLSHSLVGGVMSVLQGAKFGHGFAAAGVAQAFSGKIDGLDEGSRFSPARVVSAAVLGGTVSKITGGKFSNGAVTAAFSRIFNDEAEHKAEAAQKRLEANIKKIKAAYANHQGKACVVAMRNAYREALGDSGIAKGMSPTNYDSLMGAMAGDGQVGTGETFTFNGSRHTPLGSVSSLTTSIADSLDPGVYALGIADGTHTMTLTYDGSTYSLLDQGTSWSGDFTSGAALDAHLLQTTQDMLPYGRADFKSTLGVHELVFP